jgi:hypothetical protein
MSPGAGRATTAELRWLPALIHQPVQPVPRTVWTAVEDRDGQAAADGVARERDTGDARSDGDNVGSIVHFR